MIFADNSAHKSVVSRYNLGTLFVSYCSSCHSVSSKKSLHIQKNITWYLVIVTQYLVKDHLISSHSVSSKISLDIQKRITRYPVTVTPYLVRSLHIQKKITRYLVTITWYLVKNDLISRKVSSKKSIGT